MNASRFLIFGKVQGVFFRAATREQAIALGLVGYAKNLPDGSVEILAAGDAPALRALERWLWQGPPHADVVQVRRDDEAEMPAASGFETR